MSGMLTDPSFYVVAIPAVIAMGLAKGGFAGVGQLAVPLMALAIPPVQAAAILLPVLVLQDAVGIWAFRRDWDRRVLAIMLPGAVVGVAAGYLLATRVSTPVVLAVLGGISVLFAVQRLWQARGGAIAAPSNSPAPVGFLFGVGAGFTAQIAHAGVPLFQMWVLPKQLKPAVLIGTTAMFFGVVNWVKAPAYAALGQFTRENLMAALVLAPIAAISTVAGVQLVRRVPAERFYTLIYFLLILLGAQLIWKAIAG